MSTRKEMKARARKVLKKHYWLFVALCLASAMLGSEFVDSVSPIKNLTAAEMDARGGVSLNSMDEMVEGFAGFVEDIAQGKEEARKEQADKETAEYIKASQAQKKAILGRSRGVFSTLVNGMDSGEYLVTLTVGIRSIVGSDSATVMILIAVSVLLLFFVQTFLVNLYRVIMRRMFLEGRLYQKVPVQRVWFLLRVKKWFQAGITIFVMDFLRTLWDFTVIGGVIKHYSYYMVPYIVAENPGIKTMDAITLSRKMMDGHKWECFKFELSFVGWVLLGGITFGLTDIFYSNAYMTAAMGEYYDEVRAQAKKKKVEYSELLNDKYLFEKPDELVLLEAYMDIGRDVDKKPSHSVELTGIHKVLANVFGLTISHKPEIEAYEKEEARMFQIAYDVQAYKGNIYPTRLYPLPEKKKRRWINNLNYLRHYSVWSVILMFFIMSFVGWMWEVSLHLVTDGEFVNRGVMHGPWLPIYGAGSVMILLILNKFRRRPAVEFVMAVVLCGLVEYSTSYFLEMAHNGTKWWDYSGYFLNLNGRICAEGLLVFGIGGMLIVYALAPFLDNLIRKIPAKALIASCLILVCAFGADQVYSRQHPNTGKGITDYK